MLQNAIIAVIVAIAFILLIKRLLKNKCACSGCSKKNSCQQHKH